MGASSIFDLADDEEINASNQTSHYVHQLVMADIEKYINPACNSDQMSNYFHSALCMLGRTEREEGFRKGFLTAVELLNVPAFNQFNIKAEYSALTSLLEKAAQPSGACDKTAVNAPL